MLFMIRGISDMVHGWCTSHKQCLLQSIHMLALWDILIAIQLLTKIATPCFHFDPLCYISVNGVSLMLIVAYLLYQCQQK